MLKQIKLHFVNKFLIIYFIINTIKNQDRDNKILRKFCNVQKHLVKWFIDKRLLDDDDNDEWTSIGVDFNMDIITPQCVH